ncbi:MAG: GDSL-type esterase/lipase family protein [Phormidesmis sp.]
MSDIRICFFGDSFVNGTGDPTCLGWSGRICAAVNSSHPSLTYYNLGIRGNTSEQIEARWQMEANLRFPAECDARLVFSFGANDVRLESGAILVSRANAVTCARRILTRVKTQYPILLVGPPPVADSAMNLRIADLSSAYADLCKEIDVPYLETFQPLSQNLLWMQEVALIDGAHPAAAGYQALADLVSQWSAWQNWFV